MGGLTNSAKGTYLNIFQGRFFINSDDKTNPSYQTVEYENKDKTKVTKSGLFYDALEDVYVTNAEVKQVEFKSGNKDTQYQLTLEVGIETFILNLSVSSAYARDLIERLAGIDFSKPVTLKPYDYTRKGVSVIQGGEKFKNYFFDGTKNINGSPDAPDRATADSDDWKVYFLSVDKFLKSYVTNIMSKQISKTPKIKTTTVEDESSILADNKAAVEEALKALEDAADTNDTDDLPF